MGKGTERSARLAEFLCGSILAVPFAHRSLSETGGVGASRNRRAPAKMAKWTERSARLAEFLYASILAVPFASPVRHRSPPFANVRRFWLSRSPVPFATVRHPPGRR